MFDKYKNTLSESSNIISQLTSEADLLPPFNGWQKWDSERLVILGQET